MAQAVPTVNSLLPFSLRGYKQKIAEAEPVAALVAATAFQNTQQLGAHAENNFILKDMSSVGMALLLPRPSGSLGFVGQYRGGGVASTLTTGATMGIKLQEKLGMGIGIKLTGFKWRGQAFQFGLLTNGGILYRITPTTAIGFQLEEWFSMVASKEKPKTRFREIITGIGTSVNDNIYFAIEIRKRTGEIPGVGGLLEWQLDPTIGIRTGINTANNMLSLGMTKQGGTNNWGMDLGNHPQLGFSARLTISHALGK